jgi:hypothetical protein
MKSKVWTQYKVTCFSQETVKKFKKIIIICMKKNKPYSRKPISTYKESLG